MNWDTTTTKYNACTPELFDRTERDKPNVSHIPVI